MSSEDNDDETHDPLARVIAAAKPPVPRSVADGLMRCSLARTPRTSDDAPQPAGHVASPDPRRVGRYVLHEVLGRGSMGEVWAGFDAELGRRVALKRLQSGSLDHGIRLYREAQALARLSHPNVVSVYGVEKAHGHIFIAMEFIEGHTLQKWQSLTPRPGWSDQVKVYIDAGRGLAAAHAEGLIHRDFKPANCMIDAQGRVKVLDFGLVSQAEAGDSLWSSASGVFAPSTDDGTHHSFSESLTQTGAIVGTRAYMAPEAMGGASIDTRSDQFSFCVSLYEAVYDERPFAADTPHELLDAVLKGRVRPAPRDLPVPHRLRRILLRGIEVDVNRRWPSMEVLLAELERLLVPRTIRRLTLGAAGVGLAAAGVSLGAWHYAEVVSRCTGATTQLRGVWDEPRRMAVRDAIAGVEQRYAGDTGARVEAHLDAYATAWTEAHTRACEATSVRREQSEADMTLRMDCLHKHRQALRAVTTMLARADAQVVTAAVDVASDLPSLTRCDDVSRLREQRLRLPPPEDPAVARKVARLTARLVTVRAERDAGRYARALEQVEPIANEAEGLGHAPLLAEVLYYRGLLRDDNGHPSESEHDLRRAYAIAAEHDHDEIELRSASLLAFVVGLRAHRFAEGWQWGQVALPIARRTGDATEIAATFRRRGQVLHSEGKYKESEGQHRRALEILEESRDASSRQLASSLNDLGIALEAQGRYREAEPLHRRALRIREQMLGEHHPSVAMSLNNHGIALEKQGQYQEAEAQYRRALRIRENALGPNDAYVARSVDSLGIVLFYQKRFDEAERYYRRSLRIRERASDGLGIATSLHNLASALVEQERYEEAKLHLLRALSIEQQRLRADHPHMAYPISGLAEIGLHQRNFADARRYAERSISMREANDVAPELLAGDRFLLARALWPERTERPRALELARRARATFAEAGPGSDERRAEVERWLADHRVRASAGERRPPG